IEPAPPAPTDVEEEARYLAASFCLITDEKSLSPWASMGCLAVSLLLFALSFLSVGLRELAFVVPVLFLHESGHWLGMKLFHYKNVQMFFIPFFGAAVSGRKHAAPAWQQMVVLLLGPLPGIFLGLGLIAWLAPPPGDWRLDLAFYLVILNVINLAPLVPLDGGRVLDVMLFAGRPGLGVTFRLFAVVCLGVAGLAIGFDLFGVALGAVALGTLVFPPARYHRARLERVFGRNHHAYPEDLAQLTDAHR